MSIPPPPQALLRLTKKVISLLGNGTNRYIFWQLPLCNITSNPYGGSAGTYGLINCIAIQNGAISAVVWFYLPPSGQGVLLGIKNTQYPITTIGPYYSWLYVGTSGKLYTSDIYYVATPFTLTPGWHMAVVEEWASSTSGPYYVALYLDGQYIGQTSLTTLPLLFGRYANYPYNYIGVGFTGGVTDANQTWFFFNGVIAYVALYNRVLTSRDIYDIYQGNRVTSGLVAEFIGDNYDPSSGAWVDDVNGYIANLVSQNAAEVIDYITTEFTGGINYELLAQKIAEKITSKPISISNPLLNQYGNINIDINTYGSNLKNWFKVLSNASITSNGSTNNYYAGPYKNFLVTIYVGSVSGTSPSLTVYFNAYDPNSSQSIQMASATLTSAGGTYIYVHDFPGNQFNISWAVGGTSPSFGSVFITVYESW